MGNAPLVLGLVCFAALPVVLMSVGVARQYRRWKRGEASGWHVVAILFAAVPTLGLIPAVVLNRLVGVPREYRDWMFWSGMAAVLFGLVAFLVIHCGTTLAAFRRRHRSWPPPDDD